MERWRKVVWKKRQKAKGFSAQNFLTSSGNSSNQNKTEKGQPMIFLVVKNKKKYSISKVKFINITRKQENKTFYTSQHCRRVTECNISGMLTSWEYTEAKPR